MRRVRDRSGFFASRRAAAAEARTPRRTANERAREAYLQEKRLLEAGVVHDGDVRRQSAWRDLKCGAAEQQCARVFQT